MALWLLSCSIFALFAEENYRTDASTDTSLPWFQLKGNQYPPPDSAHYISGELIQVDHLERSFVIRVDRNDGQNRGNFDLPLQASLLPYGAIYFQGAPAALEDIPLNTHLHGYFYVRDPADQTPPLLGPNRRVTPEAEFSRCFSIEDDFSYHLNRNQLWKVDQVNLEEMKLTSVLIWDGTEIGQPAVFDLQNYTRVWKGRGMGERGDLDVGQEVLFSLTWATLYGPGRLREIWIDEVSRNLARSQQREKHLVYQQQRGLAGRVDEVDNRERILTIDLFGGMDPSLYEAFSLQDNIGIAVARDSLMTYDPVNDRKRGPLLNIEKVDPKPGGSGFRLTVKPDLLLEGYRPGRIVRVWPSAWPVIALPREEQFFGR